MLEALIKLGQVVAKQLSTAITLVLSKKQIQEQILWGERQDDIMFKFQEGQTESRGGGGGCIFETGFT